MCLNESIRLESIQTLVTKVLQKIQKDPLTDEGDTQINSVDEIRVINYKNKILGFPNPIINVDLYVNTDIRNFDDLISDIEYDIRIYIPKVQVVINNVFVENVRKWSHDIY